MDDFEFQIFMEEGEGGELAELADEEYLQQPMSFAGAEEACQHRPTLPKSWHIPHTPNLPTPHLDTSWHQLYENICKTSTADHEEEQVNQDPISWNDEKLTENALEHQKTGHIACKACHNPPMANHKVVQSNSVLDETSKWGPVASSANKARKCNVNETQNGNKVRSRSSRPMKSHLGCEAEWCWS